MSAPTEDFVSGRLHSGLNLIHGTDLHQTLRRKLFVLAGDFGFFRRNRISFMGVGQKRGRGGVNYRRVAGWTGRIEGFVAL